MGLSRKEFNDTPESHISLGIWLERNVGIVLVYDRMVLRHDLRRDTPEGHGPEHWLGKEFWFWVACYEMPQRDYMRLEH